MKVSQNCLALIKKWEGLKLEAYLDPVGIPTIGYGTIRYPHGNKVKLGDKITLEEAEEFLQFECDEKAEAVCRLVNGISLNQNQFDALVSFCYNLGTGAFANSTLLKKLKESDFVGAAQEFDRWNKGTVNGEKIVLPGLVNRRKEERELFERQGSEGTPINVEESPKNKVTWLEGYQDGDKNVIVAWNDEEVVEILSLESSLKKDLIFVLQQYKNAKYFRFAPTNKPIPSGERISVPSQAEAIVELNNPPTLNRLLVRGLAGDDVKELQNRLNNIGYDVGGVDGIFGTKTEVAVKDFQAAHFGLAEADGKVGPITWEKLWGNVITKRMKDEG